MPAGSTSCWNACWILDADDWMHLLGGKPTGLRAEIQQHVHRNPEDWPAETLFDQLGYDASDRRFALFLEEDWLRPTCARTKPRNATSSPAST